MQKSTKKRAAFIENIAVLTTIVKILPGKNEQLKSLTLNHSITSILNKEFGTNFVLNKIRITTTKTGPIPSKPYQHNQKQ